MLWQQWRGSLGHSSGTTSLFVVSFLFCWLEKDSVDTTDLRKDLKLEFFPTNFSSQQLSGIVLLAGRNDKEALSRDTSQWKTMACFPVCGGRGLIVLCLYT